MCLMTGNVLFDDVIKVVWAWLPHGMVPHGFSGRSNLKLRKYPLRHQTFNLLIYEVCKDLWFPSYVFSGLYCLRYSNLIVPQFGQ